MYGIFSQLLKRSIEGVFGSLITNQKFIFQIRNGGFNMTDEFYIKFADFFKIWHLGVFEIARTMKRNTLSLF